SGTCIHEFAGGNRCNEEEGPCALATCDEERRTCYAPETTACDAAERELRCSSTTACGASVEWRGLTRYCSGSSPECDGAVVTSDTWQIEQTCGSDEVCGGSPAACQPSLSCV